MKGIGASVGFSIGKVYKYNQVDIVVTKKSIENVDTEIQKFVDSVKKSENELLAIKEKTAKNVDEETAAIFGAHVEILNDPELIESVKSKITSECVNADYALKNVSDTFVAIFEAMDNEYIRERAADIKDVTKRVLIHLQNLTVSSLTEIDEEVIVVAKDLTPSDTAQLNKKLVKGFITDIGGRTSHSAIMARTLEIPAVVGCKDAFEQLENGDFIILDGATGDIIVDPTDEQLEDYQAKIVAYNKQKEIWAFYKDRPSLTLDEKHIELGANIGNPEDLEGVLKNGGESVGLYRTEFLYMGRSDYPNEEEQYKAYKAVLEGMGEKPVVVRTLDIGGDKELDYLPMEHEMNPFLGNRALRLCLTLPDVFKTQLRALLRASVHGNLHIMFPMIATLGEIRTAKSILKAVDEELRSEGKPVSDTYKVGIMIEIPAAAILADMFAKEVDFFSIGTNDLIQYSFAADRMNEKVAYLYQPYNPSLLRLVSMVINAAHKEGKWVGMCGEMAGEIDALPLLIGLGLDEFSMSASSILKARYLASKIDSKDAKALAETALTLDSQEEVLKLVKTFMEKIDQ